MKPYKKIFKEDREYKTTGIENIDDEYSGLNFLQNGYSVGYIEFEKYNQAQKAEQNFKKLFDIANKIEKEFKVEIKINVSQ